MGRDCGNQPSQERRRRLGAAGLVGQDSWPVCFFCGAANDGCSRLSAGGGADPWAATWAARVPLDPLGERSSPPAAVPFAAAAMWGGLQPNATRFSNIGNSCGSCGADLQVCAGSPGPALRATESAISEQSTRLNSS